MDNRTATLKEGGANLVTSSPGSALGGGAPGIEITSSPIQHHSDDVAHVSAMEEELLLLSDVEMDPAQSKHIPVLEPISEAKENSGTSKSTSGVSTPAPAGPSCAPPAAGSSNPFKQSSDILRLVQINLKHSKSASENLLIFLNINNIDVSLIQEPWVHKGKVLGLKHGDFELFYLASDRVDYRPRSCILVRKTIKAFLFPNFSDKDTTTVSIEGVAQNYMLSSVYLAHDDSIPTVALDSLVRTKYNCIIGADANARHELWGSTEINTRGESLFDYINTNDMIVCNRGNTPTFEFPPSGIYPGWKEVLDVSLCSNSRDNPIKNWRVSEENSYSDHKYILFELNFKGEILPPFRNPRKTNWDKFIPIVYNGIKGLNPLVDDVNCMVDKINTAYTTAFKATCKITRPPKNKLPPYFDEDLINLRKKVRKQFRLSYKTGDWSIYKNLVNVYNKAIKAAKSKEWVSFCEDIESAKDTARLRKILSKTHSSPTNLQLADGSWAQSSEESNNVLLDTHFPGCTKQPNLPASYIETGLPDASCADFITLDKVRWAIDSFQPFKSPGLDGIFPKMLQMTADKVAPVLTSIFKRCIIEGILPDSWKQIKVIFIPKAGKINHSKAKDFRPISLSSFVLKVFERVLDIYIRGLFREDIISASQHAYIKGKSTETALHEVVRVIETSNEHSQFSLAAFLDIEGAFNNVNLNAITQALEKTGVNQWVCRWIAKMLSTRAIHSTIGTNSVVRFATRGTPQGGVLSPLLWLLVINEVLLKIEGIKVIVIAYADDVVLISSGLFTSTISERIGTALKLLSEWATNCGLGVNPDKTELVLFTRRRKIPPFRTPSLGGKQLNLSSEAKYLGVILDSKLNWKSNIAERARKASTAYYLCRRAIGKTWGLSPMMTYWILTAIVRPILMYGVLVWWTAIQVKENCRKLDKVLRQACIGITGAMRSTPTDVLLVMLALPNSDLFSKFCAANAALRLLSIGQWKTKLYGHSRILEVHRIKPGKLDACVNKLEFLNNFNIIIPNRSFWGNDEPLKDYDIHVFTDGSKTEEGCGAGFHVTNSYLRKSYRLPNYCTVFQGEVFAIKKACEALIEGLGHDLPKLDGASVVICVDSQAAIKAIGSIHTSSQLVSECKNVLRALGCRCNLTILWVPGHTEIQGNELADLLARQGSDLHISWKESIPTPISHYKYILSDNLVTKSKALWHGSSHRANCLWNDFDKKRSSTLLNKNRNHIRKTVFLLTGHWSIGRHARRLGIGSDKMCPGCHLSAQETDIEHVWCLCPALTRIRYDLLGDFSFSSLTDLKPISFESKQAFINRINWFD